MSNFRSLPWFYRTDVSKAHGNAKWSTDDFSPIYSTCLRTIGLSSHALAWRQRTLDNFFQLPKDPSHSWRTIPAHASLALRSSSWWRLPQPLWYSDRRINATLERKLYLWQSGQRDEKPRRPQEMVDFPRSCIRHHSRVNRLEPPSKTSFETKLVVNTTVTCISKNTLSLVPWIFLTANRMSLWRLIFSYTYTWRNSAISFMLHIPYLLFTTSQFEVGQSV